MMDSNTHSVVLIGEDFSMFIDGIPDDCDHVWNGATVFETASGKVIYWHTFRSLATYTSMARDPLIIAHQQNEGDPVTMCTGSCSKCGKTYQPNLFEI